MKVALCIGINNYAGSVNDLDGCVNDAHDWAAALKKRGFAVQKLLNKAATGKAIRGRLQLLMAAAKKGDSIVIQYSGHGSYVPDVDGDEPDGTDECICPYDVSTKGVITDDELFQIFSHCPRGARLVMFSDSCNSGTVARFAPISTPTATKGSSFRRQVRFLPPGTFLKKRDQAKLGLRRAIRSSSPPGRYGALLLSGCQDTEYSYDASFQGRPNGAFTYIALRTLAKLSKSATYKDWHKAIRLQLPSQQYPQSPNLYGSAAMRKWKVLA